MQAERDFKGFDDLTSDFDSVPVVAERPATLEEASGLKSERKKVAQVFTEVCPRCRGTGRYHHASEHGTVCLKCKGKGKLTFSTSPEARAAARIKSAAKKQAEAQKLQEEALEKLKAFEALHPDIAGWWADTDFEFALSLRGAVMRTGKLTDNQIAAARKCVSKLEEAKAERLKREAEAAQAPVLDLTAISGAMGKARDLGIKRPKMRLLAGDQGFVLSFAPDTGKWGGSLYAKLQDGTYLGRITAGRFHPSRDTSTELAAAIFSACQKPLESAVAYGRRTGSCSCCGRELTNHGSIDAGIGPICESKFF
ncbi:hypothetical protein F7661_27945 (plasmid) [Pseudomonas sp. CFA]|nr:hypothetical protein F7661_27945 [Pseudomonas sp. CFA]